MKPPPFRFPFPLSRFPPLRKDIPIAE
jgi:hypothetical protein